MVPCALSVLRPLKTRYGPAAYLAVKIDEARAATQRAPCIAVFDRFPPRRQRTVVASRLEEGPRVVEKGPPGTRNGSICGGADSSGGLRENTKCLPALRTGAQRGPRARCPRAKNIYSRVDEFRRWRNDRVFGARSSPVGLAGRSIGRSIFKGPNAPR